MKILHATLATVATAAFALAAYGDDVEQPTIDDLKDGRVYLLVFSDETYAYTQDSLAAIDLTTFHKPALVSAVVTNVTLPEGETTQALASIEPTAIKDDGTKWNPGAFYRPPPSRPGVTPMTWIDCFGADAVYVDGFRVHAWAVNPPGCPDARD